MLLLKNEKNVVFLKTNVKMMSFKKKEKNKSRAQDLDKAVKTYVQTFEQHNTKVEEPSLSYSGFLKNKMLIIEAIRKGLSYDFFSKIKEVAPFSEKDWAEYLSLSKKTLQRYASENNFFFKPIHSEKIIELAEVTKLGKEVFDTQEQFYTWLNTPTISLNNLKPLELVKDSYGKEMVMDELNRIDQGIFA